METYQWESNYSKNRFSSDFTKSSLETLQKDTKFEFSNNKPL